MADGCDVRWAGYSHKEIDEIVKTHRTGLTVTIEDRLTSMQQALTDTSELVNATLQKLGGGEWSGGAAQGRRGP